ncbi:hypothetical protein NXV12_20855 [Bacteroides thetaiotaomicron]|nr:hypothetical protein [Bacteroides thetaiotaomicron]
MPTDGVIIISYATGRKRRTPRERKISGYVSELASGAAWEDIERILNGDTETLRKLLDAGRYGIGGETYVPGSTVEGYNEDHDTEFEEEDVEFHL